MELSFNPSDLALLETQEFNAKAIATAYGVPSVLLNMALAGRADVPEPGGAGRDVVAVRAPHDRDADRERVQRADVAARPVGVVRRGGHVRGDRPAFPMTTTSSFRR
jgi:hypothetical protein